MIQNDDVPTPRPPTTFASQKTPNVPLLQMTVFVGFYSRSKNIKIYPDY